MEKKSEEPQGFGMNSLSASDVEFLRLLSHGLDVDEAARHLRLRGGVGSARLARLKHTLSAATTAHLVATALRLGIVK